MSLKITTRVESYDVQPNGNVKISSLLKFFQKAAGDELLDTPLSYYSLASRNIAFVLTKMTLQFYDDIKQYDVLEIDTHARKTHGATFPRDFIVRVNGKIVCAARSMWVLLHLTERKIMRPSSISDLGEVPTDEVDYLDIPDVRRKVDDSSLSRTNVRRVQYSHLDMNNHLNNTYYSDFIFDCLKSPYDVSLNGLYLQINYKNEALFGDNIEIYSAVDTDGGVDFSANIENSDKVCFTAYMKENFVG